MSHARWSTILRRWFLPCLVAACLAGGCGPDETGTITAPKPPDEPPPQKTVKAGKKAPGPMYEAMPRGPGQVRKGAD